MKASTQITRGALYGCLSAFFYLTCLTFYCLAAKLGVPTGPSLPEHLRPPIAETWSAHWSEWGLAASSALTVSVQVILLGVTIGAFLGLAVWSLGFDRRDVAGRAVGWAFRSCLGWPFAMVLVSSPLLTAIISLIFWYRYGSQEWIAYPGVAIFVVLATMSGFGAWNREVLHSVSAGRWWNPQWPGSGTITSIMILTVSITLINFGNEWIQATIEHVSEIGGLVFALLVVLFDFAAGILYGPVVAAIWIGRLNPIETAQGLSRSLKWSRIAPFFTFSVYLAALFWILVIPPVAIDLYLWKIVFPQRLWLESQGQRLDSLSEFMTIFTADRSVLIFSGIVLPCAIFYCLALGRMVILLNEQEVVSSTSKSGAMLPPIRERISDGLLLSNEPDPVFRQTPERRD